MARNDLIREQQYWAIQTRIDELKKQFPGQSQFQIEARSNINPAAAELIKLQQDQQTLSLTSKGAMDKNPALDFLGNLAWAAGEELTLGATLGLDISGVVPGFEAGELRESFGVQAWEDNSWAGRAGGAIGQGVGFVGSVAYGGALLKGGAKVLNKVAGLGTKALTRGAGKKIRSETGEALAQIVGKEDAVVKDFAEELYQAGRAAMKTGDESAVSFFGRRKAKKVDPFDSIDLQTEINKNFDNVLNDRLSLDSRFSNVSKNLLDPANEGVRNEMRNVALNAAKEFSPGNLPRQLAGSRLFQKSSRLPFMKDDWPQIFGDMAYEATLLGVHGGLRNLGERGTSAILGLNDEHYGRRSFASDVLHGALLGGALAPVRYIKGGAAVEWQMGKAPKAGVTANMVQAAKSIGRKWAGKKATDYTPRQLQAMLRNIYYGSNKNTEFFRKIKGWTPLLVEDPRMLKDAVNVKTLQKAYTIISEDVGKHLRTMLVREAGRDLGGSFRRFTTGSIVMNAQNWYTNWEEYKDDPARLVADYVVGAFYMKRGKVLDGRAPTKRFLSERDIKGNELAEFSKAFDVLGWDKGQLDFVAGSWDKVYEDFLFKQNIIDQSNKATPEIRNISQLFEADMVPTTDYIRQLDKPDLGKFEEQAIKEYSRLNKMVNIAKKAGDEKASNRYGVEAEKILHNLELTKKVVNTLNAGVVEKQIRAMTTAESVDFINKISDIELNGKKLTLENAEIEINNLRKSAVYKITSQMQQYMETYIKNSLDRLGMWDPSMETDGTIIVHPSVKDILLKGIASHEKTGKYSDAVMTLHDVLDLADRTGIISISDRALAFTGEGKQHYSTESMEALFAEYSINTERMHDIIMDTKNSRWRDLIPGKNTTTGFLDKFILSSEPLWKALEVNQLHLRNDVGMHILTGELMPGTEHTRRLNEILNGPDYFHGRRKLKLKDEDSETTVRTIGDKPWLMSLLHNINKAWQITQGSKVRGTKEISINALEGLHEKLSEQVGNLFSNDNSFIAFKNYLDNTFVDHMLGSDTSYGAKRAINDLFEDGNPLAFSEPNSNRRIIASAKAIEREILGSDYGEQLKNADPEFVSDVRKMIERYKTEIEDPTKSKGDYIEYSDLVAIDASSPHNAKDWMQALIRVESLLDMNQISELSRINRNLQRVESMAAAFNTQAHWEKLVGIATKKITVEELKKNMTDLVTNSRKLAYIVKDAVQNNDFLMIRELANKQRDIQLAIDRAQGFTVNGKGSLEEVGQILRKVALESVSERNRKLNLDSIESVDDFIKQQTETVTRQDATGRLILQTQTITEAQFKSRYGVEQTSLDLIKGDLIAFGDKSHALADNVKGFINSYPVLKTRNFRDLLEVLEQTNIPVSEFMRQIVKPWIESEWTKTKFLPQNKDLSLTKEKFVSDLSQLLVTSMSQKKVPMGNYDNGNIKVTYKAVTDWNVGFLGMIKSLGLELTPNSVMLFGESTVAGNRIQTKLSATMFQEINSNLAVGAWPKVSKADILSNHEKENLEQYISDLPLAGQGQDGKSMFQVFRLDNKQAIILSTDVFHHIVNSWRTVEGPLRQKLNSILGKDVADKHLTNKVKLSEFKTDHIDKQRFTTETVEELLFLTRLMNDNAYYLDQYVNKNMPRDEVYKALKYIQLANPRGGITLNEKTLGVMEYVTKVIMPDVPQYRDFKRHFDSQMKRDQKQMTIYDEKDPLDRDSVFNSDRHNREKLKQQLMEENGMSEGDAVAKAEELSALQRPESKSVVDAEVYLSLPEMAAQLVARGADRSWFVWDGNKIVGFNVVIKPVVSQSKVNPDGSISVVTDKTAYKYDPTMDAAMKDPKTGEYFVDALAFKSANKVNQSRKEIGGEWTENIISLGQVLDVTKAWKPQVALDIQTQRSQAFDTGTSVQEALKIVNIDRSNIMLKSVSGQHDGTLSMAFGNYLSNSTQKVVGSWLKSSEVVSELNQHMMDMRFNPFAFKSIAEKLKEFDKERGDITAQMTGLEAILSEGGLPIFDHMRPQIERALVGNYLGNRNFASGRIVNGAYSTMTAADGLSHPIREGGVQSRLGGSGIPFFEANKHIRNLLQTSKGTESLSLVFMLSEQQAKDLNTMFNTHPVWKKASKHATEFFKVGDEIVVSGNNTISGAFEGYINQTYGQLGLGGRELSIKARMISKEIVLNEGFAGAHYEEILKQAYDLSHADGKEKIETLGEFVRFVDGNSLSAVDRQNHRTYFKDYTVTNGDKSMAKTIDPKSQYQSIRVLDNNLRTPKDGINSWVLTGIEKLIDRRKGAVSEMNSSDAINPQDADFDLDKSASFFATPAPIVKEIHAVSGYHEIASEQIWEKALMEVPLDRNSALYQDEMKKLENARPAVIRQHSIASAMYQFFTSLDGRHKANLLQPGYKTGTLVDQHDIIRTSESVAEINTIINFKANNNKNYKIMFKHGAEFVDAVQYMKKLIKHTIDTSTDIVPINDRNVLENFWFSDEVGLFKVVEVDRAGITSEEISWESRIPEISDYKNKLVSSFIQPLTKIFNLGLGYETLSDGTSRKLTFYDHVSTFKRAKYQLEEAAMIDKNLKPFLDDFLGFLGDAPGKAGTSNHPLIDGLIMMSDVHNEYFTNRIERGSDLANMLNGAPMTHESVTIQKAIDQYMQNERQWVKFASVQWEVNQLEDILNDMRSRRQQGTSEYKRKSDRKDMLNGILSEIEIMANDKLVSEMVPRYSAGSKTEADTFTAIYTVKDGKITDVVRVNKGEPYFWKRGNIVQENPRTFRNSDPIQQKHLRTMARAFGTALNGVTEFDAGQPQGYIRSRVSEIEQKFRDIDAKYADAAVKNDSYYTDLYSEKLAVLKDAFANTMSIRGAQYAKQLLYNMFTPRANPNEQSRTNYDNKYDVIFSAFRYYSNKTNEQMVTRFMTAAMDGKVPGFGKGIAKEWWKEMIQAQKIAYLMVHDHSLTGDVFAIGNMDRGMVPTLSVLPTTEVKPQLLDVSARNNEALKTIQSFLTGSYFLDPIELYRLTVGIDKSMNQDINIANMGERVSKLWQDVGKKTDPIEIKEDFGKAVYRISKSTIEKSISGSREHLRRETFSKKVEDEINCNY